MNKSLLETIADHVLATCESAGLSLYVAYDASGNRASLYSTRPLPNLWLMLAGDGTLSVTWTARTKSRLINGKPPICGEEPLVNCSGFLVNTKIDLNQASSLETLDEQIADFISRNFHNPKHVMEKRSAM